MTCKDCYFYENQCLFQDGKEFTENERKCFKDKGRIVELPCRVGDIVYSSEHDLDCDIVIEAIVINKDYIRFEWTQCDKSLVWSEELDEGYFWLEDFGKTVFLTREKLEQALKERAKP